MRRPPLLYAKGKLELAEGPILAMVGACKGSAVGRNSHASLPPSSDSKASSSLRGLARGIDTAAHLAAFERGTIAVLAGGIER
jgi:DNA processing protein